MPELPEVEVTRRGIAAHVVGKIVASVDVRQAALRWPVPERLSDVLAGERIEMLDRRAKYLLFRFSKGTLIVHLGMSGSLRLLTRAAAPGKHDHVDLKFDDGSLLRLRDPRRFGAVLWTETDVARHPLIAGIGHEPLGDDFSGAYLHAQFRGRSASVKQLLLNSAILAGIGNIYANEALYSAGIRPTTPAGSISRLRCERLAAALRETLERAIAAGGSSLRDYVDSAGNAGYFQQHYAVYGRANAPCRTCGSRIVTLRQGQRASFFCRRCQR